MTDVNQDSQVESLGEDFQDGILGPWGPASLTTVILMCRDSPRETITATLRSLFASTIQNFRISCIGAPPIEISALSSWTRTDNRVEFIPELPNVLPKLGAILVLNAGWVLTPFSLRALWEAGEMPGVKVIRSLAEGCSGTLEFWDAKWLANQVSLGAAEANARSLSLEKWISAESLGIHAFDRPEPRVFFRRGAADEHIVDVVIFDASSKNFMEKQAKEIQSLKAVNRELRTVLANRSSRRRAIEHSIFSRVQARIARRWGW